MLSQPLNIPESASFIRLILEIFINGLGNVNGVVMFIKGLLHPWFIFSLITRLLTVYVTWGFIKKEYFNFEEEDVWSQSEKPFWETEKEGRSFSSFISSWHSPLALRLILIFVYTQIVVQTFADISSKHFLGSLFTFFQNSA